MVCTTRTKVALVCAVILFVVMQVGTTLVAYSMVFSDEPTVPGVFGASIVCLPFTLLVSTIIFLAIDGRSCCCRCENEPINDAVYE